MRVHTGSPISSCISGTLFCHVLQRRRLNCVAHTYINRALRSERSPRKQRRHCCVHVTVRVVVTEDSLPELRGPWGKLHQAIYRSECQECPAYGSMQRQDRLTVHQARTCAGPVMQHPARVLALAICAALVLLPTTSGEGPKTLLQFQVDPSGRTPVHGGALHLRLQQQAPI